MRVSSITHSFAFLALSLITFQLPFVTSIDSNPAAAGLQPRLDDAAPAQALATIRRRKKCSHSGTSAHVSATGSVYGYLANNASKIAYQLPYSRTASSQPSPGYADPPQQPAGQGSSSGYSHSGSGNPGGLKNGNSGGVARGLPIAINSNSHHSIHCHCDTSCGSSYGTWCHKPIARRVDCQWLDRPQQPSTERVQQWLERFW